MKWLERLNEAATSTKNDGQGGAPAHAALASETPRRGDKETAWREWDGGKEGALRHTSFIRSYYFVSSSPARIYGLKPLRDPTRGRCDVLTFYALRLFSVSSPVAYNGEIALHNRHPWRNRVCPREPILPTVLAGLVYEYIICINYWSALAHCATACPPMAIGACTKQDTLCKMQGRSIVVGSSTGQTCRGVIHFQRLNAPSGMLISVSSNAGSDETHYCSFLDHNPFYFRKCSGHFSVLLMLNNITARLTFLRILFRTTIKSTRMRRAGS